MIRSLERVLPYLLAVPAVIPLVFASGMYYPYLAPKTILFRADFLLVLAALVYVILSGKSFYVSRLKDPLSWIPGLLLVSAYISSLVGIDFYHSFWSVFDRGDGLLTLSALVASFYMIVLVYEHAWARKIMTTVAIVGSVVGALALVQLLERSTGLNLLMPITQGRIGSTLGNAAFLASYLGLTAFVTLIARQFVREQYVRWLYAGAAAQFCAIFASATRGAVLGLLAALGLALVYTSFSGKGKVRVYARSGIATLLVIGALFFVFRSSLADAPIEIVRRIATISLSDATVESRFFIWTHVGQEALQTPILGVGAEHIEVLFNRVYDPAAIVEQWFDRAHNVYLDYFVQFGIIGLSLYLSLLAAFGYRVWCMMRSHDVVRARQGELLMLLLVVYAVQNFFVFDTVSSLWLFLFLYACLFLDDERRAPLLTHSVSPSLSIIPSVCVLMLVVPVAWNPLYANLLLGGGYLYHIANVDRAIMAMKKGLSLHTYADLEYGYQLYEMYTARQASLLSGKERIDAYVFARDTLRANVAAYPYDGRSAVYLAHVLDMTPPELPRADDELEAAITHAIDLSPRRMQPWYIRANLAIRKGDALDPSDPERNRYYDEGIAIMKEYSETAPELAEPRFVIATLYLTLADREQAAVWAESGLARYTRKDENTARRAARYYVLIEDWAHARNFLQDIVDTSEPTDYTTMYDLAKAEFILGNIDRTAELIIQIREHAPGLFETDPAFVAAFNEAFQ